MDIGKITAPTSVQRVVGSRVFRHTFGRINSALTAITHLGVILPLQTLKLVGKAVIVLAAYAYNGGDRPKTFNNTHLNAEIFVTGLLFNRMMNGIVDVFAGARKNSPFFLKSVQALVIVDKNLEAPDLVIDATKMKAKAEGFPSRISDKPLREYDTLAK